MSDYYNGPYINRLNRFGNNYQARVQGEREKIFQQYLLKSNYRVDFMYDGVEYPGSLERYKQNDTKTMQYLLTEISLDMPNGTVLEIDDMDGTNYWMVYYLEQIQTRGYNKYIVLKLTHVINWKDRDGIPQTTRAYFYGQEDNMLKDELKSRSRNHALYTEALKMSFFVAPFNSKIRKDDYFEVTVGEGKNALTEGYVVVGYDIQSTPGVEYVTVDPTYIRDKSDAPVQTPEDKDEDFYWLRGGE